MKKFIKNIAIFILAILIGWSAGAIYSHQQRKQLEWSEKQKACLTVPKQVIGMGIVDCSGFEIERGNLNE